MSCSFIEMSLSRKVQPTRWGGHQKPGWWFDVWFTKQEGIRNACQIKKITGV